MSNARKNFWEYWGFILAKALLTPLPGFLQKFILVRLLLLFKIRKKLVVKQLKMVYPQKSQAQIAKLCQGVYRNLALLAYEFFFCNQQKLLKKFEIEGLENLQHSIDQHKGIIYPNLHIGNWEIGMKYMTQKMNLKVNALAKRMRNTHLDKYIEKIRLKKRRAEHLLRKRLQRHPQGVEARRGYRHYDRPKRSQSRAQTKLARHTSLRFSRSCQVCHQIRSDGATYRLRSKLQRIQSHRRKTTRR